MGCGASSVKLSQQASNPSDRPTVTAPDPNDELTKSRLIYSRDTLLDKNHTLDRTESAVLPPQRNPT